MIAATLGPVSQRPTDLLILWSVALALLCAVASGCGSSGSSPAPSAGSATFCAGSQTLHEDQFTADPSLRASFDGITVVHMETTRDEAVDRRDSGTAGIDRIPYFADRPQALALHVGSGPVRQMRLLDARGTPLAALRRQAAALSLTVAAGDYIVELTSDDRAAGIVFVTPAPCEADTTQRPALRAAVAQTVVNYAHPGVYVNELPDVPTIVPATTAVTAFVGAVPQGSLNETVEILSIQDYESSFGDVSPTNPVSVAVYQFFANGGSDAYVVGTPSAGGVPSAADLIGSVGDRSGMYALRAISDVNLIIMPDLAVMTETDAATVLTAALPFALAQDAMMIADYPTTLATPNAISAWVAQLRAGLPSAESLVNAAIYFPPLAVTLPDAAATITGAGGTVAGRYSATDTAVGVWEASVGTNGAITGAVPSVAIDDETVGALTSSGINPIRAVAPFGPALWDDVTLGPRSEISRVNNRRLTLMIQTSIQIGLAWTIFEPIGESLFTTVDQSVTAFLTTLWKEGALGGNVASDAFSVAIDAPPQAELDAYFNLNVGFLPAGADELVQLSLTVPAEPSD